MTAIVRVNQSVAGGLWPGQFAEVPWEEPWIGWAERGVVSVIEHLTDDGEVVGHVDVGEGDGDS